MFKWDEIIAMGLGALQLSHDELFVLTPFQFTQLVAGYGARERVDAIKLAQIIVTLHNVNQQWSSNPKEVTLSEILPWYDEYIGARSNKKEIEIILEGRPIDESEPQYIRVTRRLLEQKGIDPDDAPKDSDTWLDAEKTAKQICGTEGEDQRTMGGIMIKKADPAEWGEAFPDW